MTTTELDGCSHDWHPFYDAPELNGCAHCGAEQRVGLSPSATHPQVA